MIEHVALDYMFRKRISLVSTEGLRMCNQVFKLDLPKGRTYLTAASYQLMHTICSQYGEAIGYEYLQSELHLLLTALPISTITELNHAFTTQSSKLQLSRNFQQLPA